jgi:hypothetical protein
MTAKNAGLAALTLTLLLLSACGGGDGAEAIVTPPAASNQVPASATATAQAYSRFISGLDSNDGAEPLELENVVAPTSETDEPVDA